MNCQEFWNAFPDLVDATALANHDHLADCPACAARLRSQRALKEGLKAVAGQMSRVGAPPRVEASLRAAFRAHAGADKEILRSPGARLRPFPAFAWAAAAALFVVAGFLSGWRQPESLSSAVSHRVEVAVAGMPLEFAAPAETESGTLVAENGFIPLPNAAQIGPAEEAHLVRVEVSRSAMIALGYDVKPGQASESVQADVMLGNDGMARAVRFLD